MRAHLFVDVPLIAAGVSLAPTYGLAPVAWLAGAAVAIHAWGVMNPRSSLYLPVWWRLPRGSPQVALTFDDGPDLETTPAVLDLLAKHGQRATFFVVGEHVRRHPELVRRMAAEGHALGLHSDTHSRWFACWGPGRVRRDLEACTAAIAAATGAPPPRLFRPPVGIKNPIIGFIAGRLGLRAVTWTGRAFDTGSAPVEAIVARLERGLQPGNILLLHDGSEPARPRDRRSCVSALARLLPLMAERGLRSAAIAVAERGIAAGQAQETATQA
jgi:peptidoglycan/xylan/chitin deacetylase (PgdA/CDA1 family)